MSYELEDSDYPLYPRPPQVLEMEVWSTNGPGDMLYLRGHGMELEVDVDDFQNQFPDEGYPKTVKIRVV